MALLNLPEYFHVNKATIKRVRHYVATGKIFFAKSLIFDYIHTKQLMEKTKMQQIIDLLGRNAEDKVTLFKGVITTVSFDLFGCMQVVLTPVVDKEGKGTDGRWFDVNRLSVDTKKRVMPVPNFSYHYEKDKGHGAANKPLPGQR